MRRRIHSPRAALLCAALALLPAALLEVAPPGERAGAAAPPAHFDPGKDALPEGGLCAHVGCSDGSLTTKLAGGGRRVVHGLALDAGAHASARAAVRKAGLSGAVT